MKDFAGKDGFYWWHGVVEDVADPLMLGRCKVRVFGYHTQDIVELPTSDLPWAYPMQPITSAAMCGIGTSPTGLLPGSNVFGFFQDDEEGQDPIIIGSFGGIPKENPNSSIFGKATASTKGFKGQGFYDPSGKYPPAKKGFLETILDIRSRVYAMGLSSVNEADTNRLARNTDETEMKSTVVSKKMSEAKKNISSVPDMKASGTWNEPITPFAAVYPKNQVRCTESGHVQEVDDTPGAERIHEYHVSGSFVETGNGWQSPDVDGTKVEKIVGNGYEICLGNKKIYIAGSAGLDIVVDGAVNITIGGAANIQLNGNANILAKKNISLQCEGDFKASAKKMEFFSEGDVGFSGRSVSFISDGGVMVMTQGGTIEMNSGSPTVRPSKVNVQ
jgi:hypothetical protein